MDEDTRCDGITERVSINAKVAAQSCIVSMAPGRSVSMHFHHSFAIELPEMLVRSWARVGRRQWTCDGIIERVAVNAKDPMARETKGASGFGEHLSRAMGNFLLTRNQLFRLHRARYGRRLTISQGLIRASWKQPAVSSFPMRPDPPTELRNALAAFQ